MSSIEDILACMDTDLLTDIRSFLSKTGMGPSYFGKASCGNSEVVSRLEDGKTITLATAEKIRGFMASRLPTPHKEKA